MVERGRLLGCRRGGLRSRVQTPILSSSLLYFLRLGQPQVNPKRSLIMMAQVSRDGLEDTLSASATTAVPGAPDPGSLAGGSVASCPS